MTANELIDQLRERFGEKILGAEKPQKDLVLITVDRSTSVDINRFVFMIWPPGLSSQSAPIIGKLARAIWSIMSIRWLMHCF